MRKYFFLIFLFFSITNHLKADGVGIGASAMYNLQTESYGFGLRASFKPSNAFRIVPQIAYYPSFNKINEYYAGLSLELNLFRIKGFSFYILAHGAYNGWMNAESSLMKNAKYGNWALEAGGGITWNKGCWRPFSEFRYNGNWKETNFRIGIMFVFGDCSKKGFKGKGGSGKWKRASMTCPAYN